MEKLYNLTLDEYKEILYLDANSPSGLRWKVFRSATAVKDSVAGSYSLKCKYPCWRLKLNKKSAILARIIWFMYYGKVPEGVIDHKNGNSKDNSIGNLRDVPQKTNCENRVVKNFTGTPGIYIAFDKYGNKRFRCQGRDCNGKRWIKNFAVKKYGHDRALRLAIQYRINKENENNTQTRRITLEDE